MPGRLASLVALAVLAACAAGNAVSISTVPETAVTTTSDARASTPTTTLAPSTTSTAPEPTPTTLVASEPATILVSSPDGLYRIDGHETTLLVDGPVYTGVGDHRGGVVFQRDWSPGEIFWMPAGAAEPERMVSSGVEHSIRLHDVGLGVDGPVIWYSRAGGYEIDDATEVLFTMSLDTREGVEMGVIGGWENSSTVSVGADLVVAEWWAEGYHGFGTHDLGFNPVETEWNPYRDDVETDCGPCPRAIDIATDGRRVAWIEGRESGELFVQNVVVVDTRSGEERVAVALPDGLLGMMHAVDLGPASVLVSHAAEDGTWLPPVKIDTEDGLILELAIPGSARWTAP